MSEAGTHEGSVADVGAAGSAPRRRRSALTVWGERLALPAIFVVMMLFFLAAAPGFGTVNNLRIVLGGQAPLVVLALAAMVPLVVGQFDLSVVATGGTSAVVLAGLMSNQKMALIPALAIALLIGLLVGAVNGYFVAVLHVNAFIVTMGVATILQGFVQAYTGGSVLSAPGLDALTRAATGSVWGIPVGVFWFLPIGVVIWYWIEQTPHGRHLRAIGSNAGAAELLGVSVRRKTIATFLVAGVLGSIGGVLIVAQAGSADPQTALGALLLPALAAVFLGASTIQPGLFNVLGTVLAIYFVAYLVNGLQFMGAAPWTNYVVNGAVLVGAVTASTLLRRSRGGR